MEADEDHTQETTAELLACRPENTKTGLTKEIQELLKEKRSSHNRLLANPDDKAAKAAYKTV